MNCPRNESWRKAYTSAIPYDNRTGDRGLRSRESSKGKAFAVLEIGEDLARTGWGTWGDDTSCIHTNKPCSMYTDKICLSHSRRPGHPMPRCLPATLGYLGTIVALPHRMRWRVLAQPGDLWKGVAFHGRTFFSSWVRHNITHYTINTSSSLHLSQALICKLPQNNRGKSRLVVELSSTLSWLGVRPPQTLVSTNKTEAGLHIMQQICHAQL